MANDETAAPTRSSRQAGLPLQISLWLAQLVVSVMFCLSAYLKLTTPSDQLTTMMPWTGEVPPAFLTFIGFVDLAGGVGILLPAATRILPRLTVLAALGCVVLQALAFAFHTSRGEYSVLWLNVILFALSAFVFWGRSKKAPIAPRG